MTTGNEAPLPGGQNFETLDDFMKQLTGAPLANGDVPPTAPADPEADAPYVRMMNYMQQRMRDEGLTILGDDRLWPTEVWDTISEGRATATTGLPWLERAILAQLGLFEQATGIPYSAAVIHLHTIGAVLGYLAGRGWLADWLAEEKQRNA